MAAAPLPAASNGRGRRRTRNVMLRRPSEKHSAQEKSAYHQIHVVPSVFLAAAEASAAGGAAALLWVANHLPPDM